MNLRQPPSAVISSVPFAVLQFHLADAERCRNRGDERAEFGARHCPHFDVDRGAALSARINPGRCTPLPRSA